MPDKMEALFETGQDLSLSQREDRCQKALRALRKALFMRFVVCGLLLWILAAAAMPLWSKGLLALVLLINGSGTLPLISEWKKRRKDWKALLEEEE